MKFGSHPLNLGLRFLLEMTALFAAAFWGWTAHEGWFRYFLLVGLPILLAVAWGVFAVPDDPSRLGKTVVKTAGWVRLILELGIFMLAGWAFYESGYHAVSIIFLSVVIVHYLLSYDRLMWLLKN